MAEMELVFKRGRLSYRKKSTGAERGREDFWFTRNRDGTRTMRCLAMTDDSKFVRDVTYTLGRDERPADVFIRLQVGRLLQGMGYFRVDGDRMQAEVSGIEDPALSLELSREPDPSLRK